MRISVALATHDGERYLRAQLRSLARQTHLPAELVLCDDCSGDETIEIAERFGREAPFPVRVLRTGVRCGPHETFLRAASACRGDAIAFCDQDDVWLEHKLERCGEALSCEGVLLTVHAAAVVRHDLQPTGRRFPFFPRSAIAEPGSVDPLLTCPGFAMVFRRSLLEWGDWPGRPASRHWPGHMTHDEWVTLLATAAGRTAFLAKPLTLYRQHPAQLFGVARRGPRETLARLGGPPPEAHEQVADLREEHARYLRDLARAMRVERPRGELADLLDRAAATRERSARKWRGRAGLRRRELGRSARVAALGRLALDGAYRDPGAGGLGRRALAHDLFLVVAR